MRTNTNTRRLTLNAILLAMGLVLHQITPPIFTIKPDTTLIMLFTLMVINRDSYKTCLVAGIVAGIFAGMTSAFPGGQIPNVIDKFLTTIEIKYKGEGLNESCAIEIDFPLYELLTKVSNGYRPNKKDKNQFIKFIEFISRIEMAGSQKSELIFTEKNREQNKKFRLEYDDEFEIYRFMEI